MRRVGASGRRGRGLGACTVRGRPWVRPRKFRGRGQGEGAKSQGACTVCRCARAGAKANPGAPRVCPGARERVDGVRVPFLARARVGRGRKEKGERRREGGGGGAWCGAFARARLPAVWGRGHDAPRRPRGSRHGAKRARAATTITGGRGAGPRRRRTPVTSAAHIGAVVRRRASQGASLLCCCCRRRRTPPRPEAAKARTRPFQAASVHPCTRARTHARRSVARARAPRRGRAVTNSGGGARTRTRTGDKGVRRRAWAS